MNLQYIGSLLSLGAIDLLMALAVYMPLTAGLLSVAPIGLMAVGAYLYAILSGVMSPAAAFGLALLGGSAAGWGTGLLTLRLSGFSVAITTLALSEITYIIVDNLNITGASAGLAGIPELGGAPFLFGCTIVAVVAIGLLDASVFGRRSRAVRDDELAALSVGISSHSVRLLTMSLSGLLAATAGALYAGYISFLDPQEFTLSAYNQFLMAVIIGGLRSVLGPIGGMLIFVVLPELTRFLGSWRLFVFAILVLVVLLVRARGLLDFVPWPQLPSRRGARVRTRLPRGALVFVGIAKRFGRLTVLQDISFTVQPGHIHALIGPNGAGKTTLLNIASGYVASDRGQVTLAGRSLRASRADQTARRGLRRTFQSPRLFKSLTVRENLTIVPGRGPVSIDKLLARLGLAELADRPAAWLAYGQQRRLEIGRALCSDPVCLVLDEPTAGMDRAESALLRGLLQELKQDGLCVLMVDHDMRFVMSVADRVTVVAAGVVIAEGTPVAVQSHPAVIEVYLGADYGVRARGEAAAPGAVRQAAPNATRA